DRRHGESQPAPEPVPAGREAAGVARAVSDADRARAGDRERGASLGEKHAYAADAGPTQLRAPVVVGEDAVVAPAVPGVAVGAPLAHPDPVAPAASLHDEHRARARRRCGGERRDQAANEERDPTHRPRTRYPAYSPGRWKSGRCWWRIAARSRCAS